MCASSSRSASTPRRRRCIGLLVVLAGCGGGGSSGGPVPSLPPPALASAAFLGSGAPGAGDQVVLFFSQDVMLTGAVLDDADVMLPGGTLGAVSMPPTHATAGAMPLTNTVAIPLGAGASFTPDSSTIALADGNDAVADLRGRLVGATTAVVVASGDGDRPTVTLLTLDDVDPALNGTGSAGGTLQVPRTGFGIDVGYSDPTSAVDPALASLTADVSVQTSAGLLAPGADLAGELQLTASAPSQTGQLRLDVPASTVFPPGPLTITATVVDASGMSSVPASFSFRTIDAIPGIRPFDQGQTWFLDLSRDLESFTVDCATPLNPLRVVAGANGVPDFEDLLFVLGLFGSDPSVNATVSAQLRQCLLAELDRLFPAVNVQFTFTKPGSFPANANRVPFSQVSFSQICIAGAADAQGNSGILGIAIFDANNDTQEDDCDESFGSMQLRLGVFLHTFVNQGLSSTASSAFAVTFDPFWPSGGCGSGTPGTPIGNMADDDRRLAGTLQDQRATDIVNAILRTARMAAVVTAHECGHSMGLVQDGDMPAGLYGADPVFPCPGGITSSGHLCMPNSLFPGAAQNVMSPALSFVGTIDTGTTFNSLNLSYLRETALYNNY